MAEPLTLAACSPVSRFDIFDFSDLFDFFDFRCDVSLEIKDIRTRGFGLSLALIRASAKDRFNVLGPLER